MKVKSLSRVRLLVTPWTAAYQAPPSMGFSRKEYWSGVPLPSPVQGLSLSQKGTGSIHTVCKEAWWAVRAQRNGFKGSMVG